MSITKNNLTFIIVTFKSSGVIHKCIKSIDSKIKIIVIDNSNDTKLKKDLEKKYKNLKFYISNANVGMGAANNLGIKYLKTNFAFIINPDVILKKNTVNEIIFASKKIKNFAIFSPIIDNLDYPNYKKFKNHKKNKFLNKPFEVKSVDGFSMILNIKKLLKIFKKDRLKFFDENFFMFLENDDLCRRIINKGEKIYLIPKAKIKHLGARSTNLKYFKEIEYSRNWHWMWSKYYFNKKYDGLHIALISTLPSAVSALIKLFFYTIFWNIYKKNIYKNRLLGFLAALRGKPASYRPNIEN